MCTKLERPTIAMTDDEFVEWLREQEGVTGASIEATCRNILKQTNVSVTSMNIDLMKAMIERLRGDGLIYAEYSMSQGKYDVHCTTVPLARDGGLIWDNPIDKIIIRTPARITVHRTFKRFGVLAPLGWMLGR